MSGGFFSYAARCAVGVAFGLSSVWKIRNPRQYRSAAWAVLPTWVTRAAARRLALLVASIEGVCGILLFFPTSIGQVGALTAMLLLSGYTFLFLRSRDLSAGCGCWRLPRHLEPGLYRRLVLARNGVLFVLSAIGALRPGILRAPQIGIGVVSGFLVALTILAIPEIGQVVKEQMSERHGDQLRSGRT